MSLIPSFAKNFLNRAAKQFAPDFYWKRRVNFLKNTFEETELHLLPFLADVKKTSLDIGAAGGLFAMQLVDLSKDCVAFEPIPQAAADLKSMIQSVKANNVTVQCVALSDKNGDAVLRMLVKDLGRSTIEEANILDDENATEKSGLKVTIKKLDDYHFENVGFIKIDVEGHEMAVLKGAEETIKKNLPCLLIEIEDRHKENAVKDVPLFLNQFGYEAFFILDGKITHINGFNKSVHQDSNNIGTSKDNYVRRGVYINNFIFIPSSGVQTFLSQTSNFTLK